MGVQDLQVLLELGEIEGTSSNVDFVKLAKLHFPSSQFKQTPSGKKQSTKFSLVIDGECCLDRLYGGFFSDWVSGGQWNRSASFLSQLSHTLVSSNIDVVYFFNGTLGRRSEWVADQLRRRQSIEKCLRHITLKGTPPPKIWWVSPPGLRTTLAMALRNLNVSVVFTMDDHKQEVIGYCRENGFTGIVADDADYIAFDPPRYFSSSNMKLTFKGTLETKEYNIPALRASLGLTIEQMAVLSSLLGNYVLHESDLVDLHKTQTKFANNNNCQPTSIAASAGASTSVKNDTSSSPASNKEDKPNGPNKVNNASSQQQQQQQSQQPRLSAAASAGSGNTQLVKSIANFIKNLTFGHAKDLDKLGLEVFGTVGQERSSKLKEAVQYYLDGTESGYLDYNRRRRRANAGSTSQQHNANKQRNNSGKAKKVVVVVPGEDGIESTSSSRMNVLSGQSSPPTKSCLAQGMDTSRLASDSHNELDSLISLTEATACLTVSSSSEESPLNTPSVNRSDEDASNSTDAVLHQSSSSPPSTAESVKMNGGETRGQTGGGTGSVTSSGSGKSGKQVRILLDSTNLDVDNEDTSAAIAAAGRVAPEVMRTVAERHAKGLMSPLIQQILISSEVRLPVVLEDDQEIEIPNIQLLYRPLRQMVYAILFNVHHQHYLARSKGVSPPPLPTVLEWVWTKNNPYSKAEPVKAEQLGWGVPTVQRLWFGTTVDDKRRRLRAFLTCMRSDTQLMLDSTYVPQHLLILATTLRYIMSSSGRRVLRKYELDAIIATAMDPHLSNSEYCQELKVETVSARSVQVGSLIMTGVEHALLVNDACGAPVPWVMACPWLYFDGKLLQATMARAAVARNVLELCSHRLPQVMKVERMREAVLEGLFVKWAQPTLSVGTVGLPPPQTVAAAGHHPHHIAIGPTAAAHHHMASTLAQAGGPGAAGIHHPPAVEMTCCSGVDIGKGFRRVALPQCYYPPPTRGGRFHNGSSEKMTVGYLGSNNGVVLKRRRYFQVPPNRYSKVLPNGSEKDDSYTNADDNLKSESLKEGFPQFSDGAENGTVVSEANSALDAPVPDFPSAPQTLRSRHPHPKTAPSNKNSSNNQVHGGGGRLEIAGVIVGNWGANCRLPGSGRDGSGMPPQVVTSVGGRGSTNRGNAAGYRGATALTKQQQSGGGRTRGTTKIGAGRGSGNRTVGQKNAKLNSSGNKGGQGRGLTTVSPYTGEVMKAVDYVRENEKVSLRILQQNNSNSKHSSANGIVSSADKSAQKNNNKRQSISKKGGNKGAQLVNGERTPVNDISNSGSIDPEPSSNGNAAIKCGENTAVAVAASGGEN